MASNGDVYAADFSDANGNVYRFSSDLNTGQTMLQGIGGPTALPAGQNHGSTTAVHIEGSAANGNLVLYTVDEDLTSAHLGGPAGDDRNSLWRYEIGAGATPSNVTPTRVNQSPVLVPLATTDMQRGADGKWYLGQNRSAGGQPGIVVLDANGVSIFDSLSASRTLLANPTAADIFRNVQGIAVSEDQAWMAVMLNCSDVAVIPLVNGIPDIANRLLINSAQPDINSGRDIAFDAAGNIHYVSSGQALYRVLAPGGETWAMTSWDGASYAFAMVPEPATIGLLVLGALPMLRRRRIG